MTKLHFVVNPAAGGSTCLRRFRRVEEYLSACGIPYTAVYSEYAGHACELTRMAPECDCIVAVGGDGTVRQVAGELLHTGIPLGILPFGTGNDMIRSLAIPEDLERAVRLLLDGTPQKMDVVGVNGEVYINVAGIGFDVDVLQMTRYYKNRFRGRVAYLLGVLHALFHLRIHPVQINHDGVVLDEEILLVAVGNGRYIGGGMEVTPLADPTDGKLDVCVVSRVSALGVLRFLLRFMHGRHLGMDIVRYFQADSLEVSSASSLPLQMDGEIVGATPAVFQVLPGALTVLTGLQKG